MKSNFTIVQRTFCVTLVILLFAFVFLIVWSTNHSCRKQVVHETFEKNSLATCIYDTEKTPILTCGTRAFRFHQPLTL